MTKKIQFRTVVALLTAAICSASVVLAQSGGAATYKTKCQSCHGATGTPSPGMIKMMGVKPVSDPEVKKLTATQEFEVVKNGKGKMKPIAGLTDAQIKDVVTYYRSLK
jgi:cytochrome c551